MSSLEKVVEQGLLYDYYGELLTDHQRKIYEAAVFEDLSLGELAEETGISRQGVYDLLKRCDAKLEQYEASLHLLEKHERLRGLAQSIDEEAGRLRTAAAGGSVSAQAADGTAEGSIAARTADGNLLQQSVERLQQLVLQLLEEI